MRYFYRTSDGKLYPRYTPTHNFIIWGRDLAREIMDISSWKGICDTWSDQGFLLEYTQARTPRETDYTHDYFTTTSLQSIFRTQYNATKKQWRSVACKLTQAKIYVANNFNAIYEQYGHTSDLAKLKLLKKTIDLKIKKYHLH